MLCGDLLFSGHTLVMIVATLTIDRYIPTNLHVLRYFPRFFAMVGVPCMVISRFCISIFDNSIIYFEGLTTPAMLSSLTFLQWPCSCNFNVFSILIKLVFCFIQPLSLILWDRFACRPETFGAPIPVVNQNCFLARRKHCQSQVSCAFFCSFFKRIKFKTEERVRIPTFGLTWAKSQNWATFSYGRGW